MEGVTSSIEQEIAEVRKSIRKKYNRLRRSREEKEEKLKRRYEPLRDIVVPPERESTNANANFAGEQQFNFCHIPENGPWTESYVNTKKRRKRPSNVLDVFNINPKKSPNDGDDDSTSEEQLGKTRSSDKRRESRTSPYTTRRDEPVAYDMKSDEAPPAGGVGGETKEKEEKRIIATPTTSTPYFIIPSEKTPQPDYGEMSKDYVNRKIDKEEGFDETYGVQFDDISRRFTMGDSYVTIADDKIEIGSDLKLECTPGLLELLFIKNPDMSKVREHDLHSYKKILIETNAHKKRFSSNEPFNVKLKHPKWPVIKELFSIREKKVGSTAESR